MAQTHQFSQADFLARDPEGGRGNRWLCPTPECAAHTDPRRHRSVEIVPDSGLWVCHRCHAKGQLREMWKPMEDKPFEPRRVRDARARAEAERRLASAPISAPRPAHSMPISEVIHRTGDMQTIEESPFAMRFLICRGFGVDDFPYLHQMGVRFSTNYARREATETKNAWGGAAAIVFPIRDENDKLVATQGRFIESREGLPKTISLGPIALGAFRAWGENEPPIAIVEAPLDALALGVAGVQAFALCGCRPLPTWLLDLSFTHRFWLAFDADEAGDRQAEATRAELRGVGACPTRLRPDGAKDWADLLRLVGAERLRGWLLQQADGRARELEAQRDEYAIRANDWIGGKR